ncbi:MAG: rRNA maturation RNase YbeY [Candidatus Yonathbacteria bacterium]|nr:rRNA maturation RNase YbeY [Candidatus Yonathbacteria bacterium]
MLTIKNTTKGKLPRLPFAKIAGAVLGSEYECSLVVVSSRKSQELNRIYRGKNNPTNILSFPLDKNEGEIFIDLKKARTEASFFGRSYTNFVGFLFIHAMLHLKGLDHGTKMENAEKNVRILFKI